MIKKLGLFLFLNVMAFSAFAQTPKMTGVELWKTLSDVKYEIEQDEYGDVYVPVFSEDTKKVEGQLVEVEGFIIPFKEMFKPEEFILSSLPISECFFCGSGGPETVMEIYSKESVKLRSKRVKIRGILKLNADNPDRLMYQLVNAEYVGLADGSY